MIGHECRQCGKWLDPMPGDFYAGLTAWYAKTHPGPDCLAQQEVNRRNRGEACAWCGVDFTTKHKDGCPRVVVTTTRLPDAATTVQLLEAALAKEPWRTCSCPSASDRCGTCRLHDEYRAKIETALKAAREFTRT